MFFFFLSRYINLCVVGSKKRLLCFKRSKLRFLSLQASHLPIMRWRIFDRSNLHLKVQLYEENINENFSYMSDINHFNSQFQEDSKIQKHKTSELDFKISKTCRHRGLRLQKALSFINLDHASLTYSAIYLCIHEIVFLWWCWYLYYFRIYAYYFQIP